MKNNKVYANSAIMSALMKFYSVHDLASKIAELAPDVIGSDFDVYNCKSDGFVLRRKKEDVVYDADLTKLFIKSIKELIKETDDGVESYIFDQYDFEVSDKMINHELIDQIFDVDKSGRLISIELDL